MSAHSCNYLCEIDTRFHSIQKERHEALDMDYGEMMEYLQKRYEELHPTCDHQTKESEEACVDVKELLALAKQ